MAAWQRLERKFVVAIRENHGGLMPSGQRLRYPTWSTLARAFANGSTETRYMRAIIFGRRAIRSYPIPSDVHEQPPERTWLLMTNLPGTIKKTVGHTSGLRTWSAYGLTQSKNA